VISKAASDCVAGVIEGLADRYENLLQREREISQLFLDGIIGRNFSRGLAFYLDRYRKYLESLRRMVFQEPSVRQP
jgi:hypothetical protein